MIDDIRKDLHKLADPKKIRVFQSFFKTGPGQYGHGDVFLGVTVPISRQVAKRYVSLPIDELRELLYSKMHEERLVALLILVEKFRHDPRSIARFYLEHLGQVNSWDLVDLTAPKILGPYLERGDRTLLYQLARSEILWERRVAILTTLHYIRAGDFSDTIRISEILLHDKQDLIHKAVGWMLREVGKRDMKAEEAFLKKYSSKMPRVMLRYAIERFPKQKRLAYMQTNAWRFYNFKKL